MTEILSPCGGYDSVTAAVRAGADAIYLGAGDFNARRSAKNFTPEEFSEAARYCRINGVKVYVALNTLISDSELDSAISTAKELATLGADAFILQDLGLARALRKALPEVPLHASTQMVIHSAEGLEALKEMGFCRVVAAREMDKNSLKKLCEKAKALDMEVEVFVHGALCMCLSGACLMSSQIGGRSGNRGMCAQPCRLPFSVEGGSGYDLSLKDLSLVSRLQELADMGVTSFKIEGRMKRPEYVAAATAACRASIDNGFVPDEIRKMLGSIFSRSGFTEGYYENKLGKDMFGRRSEADIAESSAIIKSIHELYRVERPRIAVDMKFSAREDEEMRLEMCDGENIIVVTTPAAEIAKNRPTDGDFVRSKLEKLGGTCYFAEKIVCEIGEGLAISGGVIGDMRRSACELLDQKRGEAKPIKTAEFTPSKKNYGSAPCGFVMRLRGLSQMPDDTSGISAIILPVETDFSGIDLDMPLYAELPRAILGSEGKVLEQLLAAKPYIKGAVCGNLCTMELCKKAGVPFATDMFMNIYNNESASVIKELGAEWYTASVEALQTSIKNMPAGKAFFAYGYLPLMVTRNCPNKNGKGCSDCGGLAFGTDRLGNRFAIACRNGFSEIYNTVPHYLLDRLSEFSADIAILYFTLETKDEVAEILRLARSGGKYEGKYTRGLYYRTIL